VIAPALTLTIRCRLRELRGQRSLQQVSDVCGLHRGTLSQLERGERLPRPSDLAGLRRAYGPETGWYQVEVVADSADVGAPPAVASTLTNGAEPCAE
jgi:transcriptional regulator with XRE-family HTH domain